MNNMDAQGYYDSLLAQGYTSEDATKYTQEHYPEFGQAAVAPAPMPIPAPGEMPAPAPMPMPGAQPMMMGMPGVVIQQSMMPQATTTSKGMRITNGIFGILMSLALIGYSLLVIGIWAELSEAIEGDIDTLDSVDVDEVNEFSDGIESFLSTISFFYYAILLVSFAVFIISIFQFLDKSWGTKALLGSTGLLLVLLLATGAYEASSFAGIAEDYENLTGESIGGDMPSFFEVNGTIGGYCAGVCFGVYALLAFIGRPKSPPVQIV